MAADINMFGPGGENLSGLFVGQQFAQDMAQKQAQQQLLEQQAADQAAQMQQRNLSNQYEQAILPDKIQQYKTTIQNAAEDRQIKKLSMMGDQFGQLGSMLQDIPPAGRHAALSQLASQYGVGMDHPIMQQLSQIDPNQLPDTLNQMSERAYNATDAARAAKNKSKEAYDLAKMQRESAERIAAGNNAATLGAARIAAASRENVANAKAGGGGLAKMSVDQRISYFENKKAVEGLTDDEDQALDRLKEFKLQQATIGRPDTGPLIGQPSARERIDQALGRNAPGGSQDVSALAQKAWGDYNPNKYEYRINPQTGKLQRRER